MKHGRAKTKTGTRIAAVLVGRDVLELAQFPADQDVPEPPAW
jgi:hypothetical protein